MINISRTEPKAKKEHRCDWCGGVIQKGEIYDREFNVDGGDAFTWKNHKKCMGVAHDLDMFHDIYEGVDSDYFWECVLDYFKEKAPKDLKLPNLEKLNWVINHLKNK